MAAGWVSRLLDSLLGMVLPFSAWVPCAARLEIIPIGP